MSDEPLDMNLLRALAVEGGGRRTGALKRAGLIDWRLTPAGWREMRKLGVSPPEVKVGEDGYPTSDNAPCEKCGFRGCAELWGCNLRLQELVRERDEVIKVGRAHDLQQRRVRAGLQLRTRRAEGLLAELRDEFARGEGGHVLTTRITKILNTDPYHGVGDSLAAEIKCQECGALGFSWTAISPAKCPECDAPRRTMDQVLDDGSVALIRSELHRAYVRLAGVEAAEKAAAETNGEIVKAQAEANARAQAAEEREARRWQERLNLIPEVAAIDASGNESGDMLDYSADQVLFAINGLKERLDAAEARAGRLFDETARQAKYLDDKGRATKRAEERADRAESQLNYQLKLLPLLEEKNAAEERATKAEQALAEERRSRAEDTAGAMQDRRAAEERAARLDGYLNLARVDRDAWTARAGQAETALRWWSEWAYRLAGDAGRWVNNDAGHEQARVYIAKRLETAEARATKAEQALEEAVAGDGLAEPYSRACAKVSELDRAFTMALEKLQASGMERQAAEADRDKMRPKLADALAARREVEAQRDALRVALEELRDHLKPNEEHFGYCLNVIDGALAGAEMTAPDALRKAARDRAVAEQRYVMLRRVLEIALEANFDGLMKILNGAEPEGCLACGEKPRSTLCKKCGAYDATAILATMARGPGIKDAP